MKVFSIPTALLGLALVSAAVAQDTTADIFDDSEPTSDPNDLIGTIGAIFSNSTGVQGVVTFSQERGAPGQVDFISINVKISKGLTKGKSYPWHIHQNPASANGQCGSVGNHFDPLMINQSSLYKCQKNNPNAFQATCELGDLAGKLGNLNVTADDGSFSGTFSDPSIPIDGTNTIVNRSLVIHVPNTKNVLACATIRSLEQEDVAKIGAASSHMMGAGYTSLALAAVFVSSGLALLI